MGCFMLLFILSNNGKNIFGRFLKYAAYECWLSPLCIIISSIASVSQVADTDSVAGMIGAGLGGGLLAFIFAIGGGLLGVVLYLIGNASLKDKKT
jgi:hypothetical protein